MTFVGSRRVAMVFALVVAMCGVVALGEGRVIAETTRSLYVRLGSVDIDAVRWTEWFWAERFELCRRAMIPGMLKALENPENAAYLDNFRVAAGLKRNRHYARTIQNIANILGLENAVVTPSCE